MFLFVGDIFESLLLCSTLFNSYSFLSNGSILYLIFEYRNSFIHLPPINLWAFLCAVVVYQSYQHQHQNRHFFITALTDSELYDWWCQVWFPSVRRAHTHSHIPFHICKHHLADQPTWKFHTSKKFNNILKRARLPNMWCGLWCDVICHVSQSLVNFSFFLSRSLALCQNFIFICHELAFDQCDNHEQIFFVIAFNGWHVFFYPPIYSPVALSYYEFFLYNNNG